MKIRPIQAASLAVSGGMAFAPSVAVAQQTEPCRIAAKSALERGDQALEHEQFAAMERAWVSARAWYRHPVTARRAAMALSHQGRSTAAAAVACEIVDDGEVTARAKPELEDIVRELRKICEDFTSAHQSLTPVLEMPEPQGCVEEPSWQVEMFLGGRGTTEEAMEGSLLETQDAPLVVRFVPTWRNEPEAPARPVVEPQPQVLARPIELKSEALARPVVEPQVAPPEPEPQPTGWCAGNRLFPCVATGVGVGVALAALIPLQLTRSERNAYKRLCPNGSCPSSAETWINDANGRLEDYATAATTLLATGGLIAAAGVVWNVLESGISLTDDPASTPAASVACDAEGCLARFVGDF